MKDILTEYAALLLAGTVVLGILILYGIHWAAGWIRGVFEDAE